MMDAEMSADYSLFEASHAAFPIEAEPVLQCLAVLHSTISTFRMNTEETEEHILPGRVSSLILMIEAQPVLQCLAVLREALATFRANTEEVLSTASTDEHALPGRMGSPILMASPSSSSASSPRSVIWTEQ
jgi:hypothetical protein